MSFDAPAGRRFVADPQMITEVAEEQIMAVQGSKKMRSTTVRSPQPVSAEVDKALANVLE